MKPKVRARLTSFRKEVVEKSIERLLRAALEDRVIELDLEVDLEAIERSKLGPLVAVLDAHRFLTRTKRFGRALLLDSGRLQQENERTGAAVHDRHFRRAQLDKGIVDSEPGERRQQMLDGRDPALALAQGGPSIGVADILGVRADVRRAEPSRSAGTRCPRPAPAGRRVIRLSYPCETPRPWRESSS